MASSLDEALQRSNLSQSNQMEMLTFRLTDIAQPEWFWSAREEGQHPEITGMKVIVTHRYDIGPIELSKSR